MRVGSMTQDEPWTVRHLYSTADPKFGPYLQRMTSLLGRAEQAGWISELYDVPLSEDGWILPAFDEIGFGELVIVDLHGCVDDDGTVWLGTMSEGPYACLADLRAQYCRPAAFVLTNCWGAREQFHRAIARIICDPVAVVGHFDEAAYSDHAPIAFVRAILEGAPGADPKEAFRRMDEAVHDHRANPWGPEVLQPS